MIDSLISESVTLLEELGAAPESLLTEDHEGSVWVAIVLPDHAKAFLKRYQTGEARDDDVGLHITLAYLGKGDQYTPEQIKSMRKAVEKVVAKHAPLEFSITGSGRFAASPNSDGLVPVVLLPSAKGLAALRTDIVRAIERVGVKLPGPFDFLPHICVGYVNDPEAAIPKVTRGEDTWITTQVSFFVNPERNDCPLKGSKMPIVKEDVDVEEGSITDRMKALVSRKPAKAEPKAVAKPRTSLRRHDTRTFWMGAYDDAKAMAHGESIEALIATGSDLLEASVSEGKNPLGNAESRRLHHAARSKELGLRARKIHQDYLKIEKPTDADRKKTLKGLNAADISAQRHAMKALPYDEATEGTEESVETKRSDLLMKLRRERRSFGKPGSVTPSKHPDVLALGQSKLKVSPKKK